MQECKTVTVIPDLVKIRKTWAETDINLLYKKVQNYMQMISNMT
jgi:hypothetical protein